MYFKKAYCLVIDDRVYIKGNNGKDTHSARVDFVTEVCEKEQTTSEDTILAGLIHLGACSDVSITRGAVLTCIETVAKKVYRSNANVIAWS